MNFKASTGNPAPAIILADDKAAVAVSVLHLRLAEKLAPRRWRDSIRSMTNSLQEGEPLEEVLRRYRPGMPKEFHSLMDALMSLPDPTGALIEALRVRSSIRQSWNELLGLIAYPAVLFVFGSLLCVGFTFVLQQAVSLQWMDDFGLANAEQVASAVLDQHYAILGLAQACLWTVLILLTIRLVGPRWALAAVLSGVAVFGRPLRWIGQRELLARYAIFFARNANKAQVFEQVAASFRHSSLSIVAEDLAKRVMAGQPLGRTIADSMLGDSLSRPMLLMLDDAQGQLPQMLEQVSESLGRMIETRCRTLRTVLPMLLLLALGGLIFAALSSYITALFYLIQLISRLA